ncbi:MAG TPA: bifunctional 3-(3-hydroxy-phenyl)propionate/3-hydroxycinnamic acid hydroxylase, partial [Hyphomicrobiaceae bacterium]|nr:bifunctional 3-(3-hydroxy-phenyl)propionate/3-hydroxycinnamic acid hydroxylase [Hyphomicrobiaceae bacterium]
MTGNHPDFDIAIVGFGPVGATLANLLGLRGVATVVLDREGPAYHLPRAVHFDDEVMRVLQTIGIAGQMSELVHVNPGMRFVDACGNLLLDWPRPQEISRQGWHPSYRFHQPDLERHLRTAVTRHPSVTVRTGCDVIRADDTGKHVALSVHDKDRGQTETITARYTIGCDGARSFVRDVMGSGLEDYGFHERWLVVDAVLNRPKPELGDFSIQYCDTERPATYVRGTGNRRRWEITLHAHEASEDIVSPEFTWQLLSRWLMPDAAELERTAVYTFHSCIAEQWRKGRLLIAGDSAHQTPPFMGQGLCAGIRDAANLAWKLALVSQGQAGANLLDSYQSERHPHVRAYVETALRLGRLINMDDPKQALQAAMPQGGSTRMSSIAPALGPGLSAGDIGHTGALAWQLRLADGRLLDDLAGYHFVLICDRDVWRHDASNREHFEAESMHVVFADVEPAAAEYLTMLGVRAVLLRPDRYILGTASSPAELSALGKVVRNLADG